MIYRIMSLYPYNIFAQAWLMEVIDILFDKMTHAPLFFFEAVFPVEENVACKSLLQILRICLHL